jgi:hypothetical protein
MISSLGLLSLLLPTVVGSYIPESTLATDLEATKSLAKLVDVLESGRLKEYLGTHNVEQRCRPSQLAVRRE